MNPLMSPGQCLAIASDLRRYLKTSGALELSVHSVFNRSVNTLTKDGELVTFLASGRDMVPMGLVAPVESIAAWKLYPGDTIRYDGGFSFHLPHDRGQLSFRNATVIPVSLNFSGRYPITGHDDSLELIRQALLTHESTGISSLAARIQGGAPSEDAPPMNIYSAYIARDIDLFLDEWGSGHFEAAFERAKRLIGFGPGLTPSCDDFLAGILLWSYYDKSPQIDKRARALEFASQLVALSKERTTLVSYHMLRHASHGRANALYLDLLVAMGDEDFLEEKIDRALAYGASSGADFLFGLYAAAILSSNRNDPSIWIKKELS